MGTRPRPLARDFSSRTDPWSAATGATSSLGSCHPGAGADKDHGRHGLTPPRTSSGRPRRVHDPRMASLVRHPRGMTARGLPLGAHPHGFHRAWAETGICGAGNRVDWRVVNKAASATRGTPRGKRTMMTDSQPAPLQPPSPAGASLTLTAPPPPPRVAATAAPRMAPAVEAAALPGLDAKVDAYLDSLMTAAPRSPEFAAKATDVRTMGDGDIRRAAETSNRLLKSPVKALQEGGLVRGVQGRHDPARAAPHRRGPRPQARPPAPRSSSA